MATELKEVTLKRSGKRPLKFVGERIASASTSSNQGHPDFSGETGISHEARVYRTGDNRYVLEYIIFNAWQGQEDSYRVHVADGLEPILEIIEELPARVANQLLQDLDGVEDIAEEL
jgi:hypothetical protein